MHPLISLINGTNNSKAIKPPVGRHVLDFYKTSFSSDLKAKIKYGQEYYDFNEGGMLSTPPHQIIGDGESIN
ncbi:MAG: hypothetical protein WKF66_09560 [Pedobacter sp.]